MDGDGLLGDGSGGFEIGAGGADKVGVIGAPEEVTGADPGGVDGVIGEGEFEEPGEGGADVIEAAAFFILLRAAPGGGIEDDAVAGFEGGDFVSRGGFDVDAVGLDLGDGTELDAAVAGMAATDDGLVVDAG